MATVEREQAISNQPGALEQTLALVARRLRVARWVRHASRGALIGIGVALAAAVLAHWDLLPDWLPLEAVILIVLLLGIGIGTVTAFVRPIAAMDAARLAESRLGLKERLSSALEFERSVPPADPEAALLRRLQQEDADAHARALKPTEAIPIRIPWETKALIPAALLLILALVLPNLPIFLPPGLAAQRAVVKKTGQKLVRTARLIEKQADAQHLNATKRAAQNMQKLGQKMAQRPLDKKHAMVQMAKLTKQMQDEQRKLAQMGSGLGGKSLADAGQQLAQALQSQGAQGMSAQGGGAKASATPGSKNGANGKGGPKSGSGAAKGSGANGKKNGQNAQKGFNVPSFSKKTSGQSRQSSAGQGSKSTPEVQKAAQAMQQGSPKSLSEQLRQLAQRVDSGKMSESEKQQAAQDLQKLADALKGTPLTQTQKHSQAAASAMQRGDTRTAAQEMRKAADAAERETQQQLEQQGLQNAQSSLQSGEGEMASAANGNDISAGTYDGSQGQQGNGQGPPGSGQRLGQGDGLGASQAGHLPHAQKYGSGRGKGGSGGGGQKGGKPGDTGEGNVPLRARGSHLDPASNPKYGKIYRPKPGAPDLGGGKVGPLIKTSPGAPTPPGQSGASSVPYYNYAPAAKQSAESAMDKEDIPPAYRNNVKRYFESLQPTAPAGRPAK